MGKSPQTECRQEHLFAVRREWFLFVFVQNSMPPKAPAPLAPQVKVFFENFHMGKLLELLDLDGATR